MNCLNKSKEPIQIISHTNPVSPPSISFTNVMTVPAKRDLDMKAKSYVEVNRAKLYKEDESL